MSDSFDLSTFLTSLPNLPGVYRMLDAAGQVLYVGKAISLKRRVGSYFQKNDLSPRIALMVKQVARIEVTLTRSEAEALILENNLIKSLAPKYNILFRDDKSYPYLKFSGHTYPQMSYYRGNLKKPHQYFGPYPNSYAVRDSIHILQKVFQLRTCEDSVFEHRDRPCLLQQIHRCSAPCVGYISAEDYQDSVDQAVAFLNGKTAELTERLQQKMQQAAAEWQFEAAARYRDQLQALGTVQSQQFIDSQSGRGQDIDVLSAVTEAGMLCLQWVSIRGGRHVGDRSFFPDHFSHETDDRQSAAEAFVAQHYLGKPKPDVILSDFRLPESLRQALNAEAGHKIQFIDRTVGERKVWLNMAQQNAKLAIAQKALQNHSQQLRLDALAELMQLPSIQRLECFDISHTQGEATVASCVVYDQGKMQPGQYRRYNINSTDSGDDYAAMREVLTRRYGKLQTDADAGASQDSGSLNGEGAWRDSRWPDVVVIDGGLGQVNIARQVWQELGLDIPIVGVAKGPERKAGLEELILPHSGQTLQLPEQHPALHLLQTVRDEAHRFAITGHRARRGKARTSSSLNDIPGIGAKRRQSLLTRFGGLRGVMAASKEDLAQVDGISQALAEKIHDLLHQ